MNDVNVVDSPFRSTGLPADFAPVYHPQYFESEELDAMWVEEQRVREESAAATARMTQIDAEIAQAVGDRDKAFSEMQALFHKLIEVLAA